MLINHCFYVQNFLLDVAYLEEFSVVFLKKRRLRPSAQASSGAGGPQASNPHGTL